MSTLILEVGPLKHVIVKRLFQSFSELENSIKTAKIALERNENTPLEVLERISSYEEILDKQRSLATDLCHYVSKGDWEEVSRHIKIINGLSVMIRDDAKEIVAGTQKVLSSEEREMMLL